ncbi:copper chaperone PCu(A)C [Paenarthrobacter nitroguajacolicus]|uniref:copper chaperone PCu(A)C n=1 Tax=Paenarthrobacter nitroguajacolicus TaxID=211146 RepID=UPI003AEB92A5
MSKKLTYVTLSVLTAASLALSGCGQENAPSTTAASSPSASAPAALTVSETWAKALESGMTPVFGTIENTTEKEITVSGASTAAAKVAELHETVSGSDGSMKMQPKEGGFVIPAKGTFKLEPGANHIMLMDLTQPVKPGDDITVELQLADGGTTTFTAQVKDFAGANEEYSGTTEPEQGSMDGTHSGMVMPSTTPSK